MKCCSKCLISKEYSEFSKDKGQRDGLYPSCKDCKKIFYKSKAKEISLRNSEYQKRNADKVAKYQQVYRKYRLKNDDNYRLSIILRHRINSAIKNSQRAGSAIKDLGCSIDELKTYLECKFQPGMTWSNHTKYGWHIDHIVPLSKFDLSDSKQFKEACHYTNLQPMWWRDNLVKSNKMEII